MGVISASCGRDAARPVDKRDPIVFLTTPSAAAPATTTRPAPTRPRPTATSPPSPTPEPPPFPTPVVDLTDYAIYRRTLLDDLADEADRLPDAPHYFIRARLLEGPTPSLEGVQRVRVTNREGTTLEELYFRLYPNLPAFGGHSEVHRVLVDGRQVDAQTVEGGAALRIPLAGGLPDGGTADVTLWFAASLPTQVTAGTAGAGLYGYVQGVYDLASFYPTLAVYDHRGWNLKAAEHFGDALFADVSFYQVELTVPPGHLVAASGSTLERIPNADGTTTWRIAAGPVRSFYAAVTDRWLSLSTEVDGVQVNAYHPAGGEESARTALAFTRESLRAFNTLFGRYPYRELDVAPLPTTAFGMEYAGLIGLAASFYTQAGGAFSIAAPHEVAHQWFFNLIGNDQFQEPWLDESLANYAVYLYYEQADWPEMQNAIMENVFRYRFNAARSLGLDRPVGGAVSDFDQGSYVNIVYSKGPLFLHAVRQRIGDAAFFAAMLDYARRNRFGIAYAGDLFEAFRSHSQEPIDDLITLWIYGE